MLNQLQPQKDRYLCSQVSFEKESLILVLSHLEIVWKNKYELEKIFRFQVGFLNFSTNFLVVLRH